MTAISAGLVKELREQTGAGMMDCKRALEETGGDVEAARKLLREKGMATAGKRASRETPEGRVLVRVDDGVGAIVAVGCETEPVSKNDEFLRFAERVLDAVVESGAEAVESLEDERTDLVGRIGENIRVVGASRMEAADGETLVGYVHPPAQKIGVLVEVRGGTRELARDLAMHIAFARPRFRSRDEVPAEEVAAEREILERQEDVASKPEQVRPKIVEGRLQKWYAESVLPDQQWFRGTGDTVAKELGDAEVVDFVLYALQG